ncbi:MAG: hypothetical protein C4575_07145 [Desulforudis sp.]|nr:MAG: hypothetical protein C4575_07145 [Desulforudis sp.]
MGKLCKDERGPVLLEFVISCILLIIIWAGICNLGLVFKDRMAVAAAVREAGRTAAITDSAQSGIQTGHEVLGRAGIGADRAAVSITAGANVYTATVTCRSPIALPFVAGMLGGSPWENHITMSDTKHFRREPSW